jgi:hypothetical protein
MAVSRTENIAPDGTVLPSESLYTEPDETNWHAAVGISKRGSNIIPLIYEYKLHSDFQKKNRF